MMLPKDPKALKIIEAGKKAALELERQESLATGELRRGMADFANAVAWAEERDNNRT